MGRERREESIQESGLLSDRTMERLVRSAGLENRVAEKAVSVTRCECGHPSTARERERERFPEEWGKTVLCKSSDSSRR
jgi:hypothetical protein